MANETSHKSAIIERRKAFCKRHYEAIAQVMQEAMRNAERSNATAAQVVDYVTCRLADLFANDNGSFKRDRFVRACVPGANVRARS
jgi:hypothetical protein